MFNKEQVIKSLFEKHINEDYHRTLDEAQLVAREINMEQGQRLIMDHLGYSDQMNQFKGEILEMLKNA